MKEEYSQVQVLKLEEIKMFQGSFIHYVILVVAVTNVLIAEQLIPYSGCFEGSACDNGKYCCPENYNENDKCSNASKDYCAMCPYPQCAQPMPEPRGLYICITLEM